MNTEGIVRLGAFLVTCLGLGVWEVLAPRRKGDPARLRRWIGNLGLVVVATAVIRLVTPVLPVALAVLAGNHGWGLFSWLGLPALPELILAFLVLDLAIYFQHRVFHAWRPLWRLHRVHHADTFYDFTTGIRFHPLEYLISLAFKLFLVLVLGPPAMAVLAFEVVLNCVAMFNHANVRLPLGLDRGLRLLVVTPDMHRVHHSTDPREMNRNFGFNLPWWDRLFGTYKPQPHLGHEKMVIGMNIFRDPKYRSLFQMLVMPFI